MRFLIHLFPHTRLVFSANHHHPLTTHLHQLASCPKNHHESRKPTVTINNTSLKTLAHHHLQLKEAMQTLLSSSNEIQTETYIVLLESCTRLKSLEEGRQVHQHILHNRRRNDHINNYFIQERLTYMYVTCGDIQTGRLIFDQIPKPNTFLWNFMIRTYAWNNPFEESLFLYRKMLELGIKPNKFTFPFVLKACSGLLALDAGKKIHDEVVKNRFEFDVFICTALIDMYVKCGCLDYARQVFDKMPQRDVVAWNSIIAGYSLHGFSENSIGLVLEMQKANQKPNSSTLVAVLPSIGKAVALEQGKSVHGYCVRRCFYLADVLLGTALLDMYAKCDCLDYAKKVFDSMIVRNEVTWSAMVGAYVICDHMREALGFFDWMLKENEKLTSATIASILRACAELTDVTRGKRIHGHSIKTGFLLDLTVCNSFLSMYAKGGFTDDAIKFFYEMPYKDTVSYSAIISGCSQNGCSKEALLIFHEMQLASVEPDLATMVGLLPACAHLAALQHGRCNHVCIIVHGYGLDLSISNALIDMYSKCGSFHFARQVFDRMPKRDVVSWNSMIAGYGIHGLGKEALLLFSEMTSSGIKPDDITFICLLSACSHSGLVNEGKNLYDMMSRDLGIVPRMEHHICMVDLLGRGGLLEEAQIFIRNMPFEPDVRVWGALLGACRIHKNIKLGEKVSKIINSLGPEGTGNFVLLSNIYSAAGRWDDAANVRIMQRAQGFRKTPGCSWIEISGMVHAFVGGDLSHPQSEKIHESLEEISREMKKLGYLPDTSFVLQDVEEEEKERILLYHSEKLAIAFGLLNSSSGMSICITKNLRVCGDCHASIKLISSITKRVIIVRDAIRFHHFGNGICSCGDFW